MRVKRRKKEDERIGHKGKRGRQRKGKERKEKTKKMRGRKGKEIQIKEN